MRNADIVDLSVAEIMSTWPNTIRTFLDRRMHCVGCPIAPFHTLPDAAEEHGLLLSRLVADIELMFSHIDQNLAGLEFPEHNFVFTEQFTELLKTYRLGASVSI